MQYFFTKIHSNKQKNIKQYDVFRVNSLGSLTREHLIKLSRVLDAKYVEDLFNIDFSYCAITYISGSNSPWSTKTKDILDSCLNYTSYQIERFKLYELPKTKNKHSFDYDQMTEAFLPSLLAIKKYLNSKKTYKKQSYKTIPINKIKTANIDMGLAMSDLEIDYLVGIYKVLKRNPTDVELMMFSQINSEHCRHKIFNSEFFIEGKKANKSLFAMIKSTYRNNHDVISAYKDNSSIIKGKTINELVITKNLKYKNIKSPENYIIKAETHNHPTAISPYSGAATGSGGEIRDEGATGRGSTPKVGFCGYTLSNLNIPGYKKKWEINSSSYPSRIKTSYEIIIDAPIGAARYNNEFGRPNIFGFFRTFEQKIDKHSSLVKLGYHKPIMIAGGIGSINNKHTAKNILHNGDLIVILGGPSFRIGIGGGAASSMQSGLSSEALDFASVQRDNAEIQRRCQEVINTCTYQKDNPIVSIHDIGAGGLCNAVPEIVNDFGMGAIISLDNVSNAEESMSSLEIWCNESQERYVIIIREKDLAELQNICTRENCPMYVIGSVTSKKHLKVMHGSEFPIDISMKYLLGKPPIAPIKINKSISTCTSDDFDYPPLSLCIKNVLQLPSVSDKGFLVTIGDRSVSGLVARDQLIGPNQVPVSNFSITKTDINSSSGQALTMGEKPNIASISATNSVEMAFGEIITNLSSVYIGDVSKIKLSANWMANSSEKKELFNLYQAVERLSQVCRKSNIVIPVGKDSLSMSTKWGKNNSNEVKSPLSLILSAFVSIDNVDKYVTPYTNRESQLFLVDLGRGKDRMGGSGLDQTLSYTNHKSPDINKLDDLLNYYKFTQELVRKSVLNAYHDRSDGGLITTLIEMAFVSNMSVDLKNVSKKSKIELIRFLFNEELGGIFAIDKKYEKEFIKLTRKYNLEAITNNIGNITKKGKPMLKITACNYSEPISKLRKYWSELSYLIQSERDNKKTALSEYKAKIKSHQTNQDYLIPKLHYRVSGISKKYLNKKNKPKIAIFREQGVNGHKEMANAFNLAGFDCYDVNTNDVIANPALLNEYHGLVACGGFSYGDVLGAGRGWANKIKYNHDALNSLSKFFSDKNKFTLGVCNGCQMLSNLKSIIPGSKHWPKFIKNNSNQFEARQVLVKIPRSNSMLFKDMHKSILPIIVSHGEGKISIKNKSSIKKVIMQYVDTAGKCTEEYPYNPNGSLNGVTGFCNNDGRINIMMPHPERLAHINNFSWAPEEWKLSPWLKLFNNAREWVD